MEHFKNQIILKSIQLSHQQTSQIDTLVTEFASVFEGVGCFKDKATGENIEVRLEMDPNATPVAQKSRHVPYHLQQPLKKWIDEAVEKGIFEEVPTNEEITWCFTIGCTG